MALAEQLVEVSSFLTDHPEAGRLRPSATSTLVGPYEIGARTDEHEVTVDEPKTIGGNDAGPSPVELALVTLGACQAITYRLWATKLGIGFDAIDVAVAADYDARGLLGIDGHGRPGLTDVQVSVTIEGDELDRYDQLRKAVDEHCPILDLFSAGVSVTTALTIV